MNDVDDTIASIDALIDEQLADGEPEAGYDHGDPTFPKCPHCGSHWHGLPITYRMVIMGKLGWMPEGYTYASDDSPIWCPGSQPDRRRGDFNHAEMSRLASEVTSEYFAAQVAANFAIPVTGDAFRALMCAIGVGELHPLSTWLTVAATPSPPAISDDDIVGYRVGDRILRAPGVLLAGRGNEATVTVYDERWRPETSTTTEGHSDVSPAHDQ